MIKLNTKKIKIRKKTIKFILKIYGKLVKFIIKITKNYEKTSKFMTKRLFLS